MFCVSSAGSQGSACRAPGVQVYLSSLEFECPLEKAGAGEIVQLRSLDYDYLAFLIGYAYQLLALHVHEADAAVHAGVLGHVLEFTGQVFPGLRAGGGWPVLQGIVHGLHQGIGHDVFQQLAQTELGQVDLVTLFRSEQKFLVFGFQEVEEIDHNSKERGDRQEQDQETDHGGPPVRGYFVLAGFGCHSGSLRRDDER